MSGYGAVPATITTGVPYICGQCGSEISLKPGDIIQVGRAALDSHLRRGRPTRVGHLRAQAAGVCVCVCDLEAMKGLSRVACSSGAAPAGSTGTAYWCWLWAR